MNNTVQKITFPEQETDLQESFVTNNYLGLVNDIEVQCSIRIGTLSLTIGELRQLHIGQMLRLDQKTSEPVDIILNDQVIARGELMSHEEQFAVYIKQVHQLS